MICPIKNHARLINPNAARIYTDECGDSCSDKERPIICALWDEKKNQCCIKTLAQLKLGVISTHPA